MKRFQALKNDAPKRLDSGFFWRRITPFCLVIWGLVLWGRTPRDPDLGWHLLGGAWIASHGGVPRADFINTFNLSWHDYHWLAQWVMFELYRIGGFELLRLSLGFCSALIFVAVYQTALICTPYARLKVFVAPFVLVALALIANFVEIRPQVIALLMLTWAVLCLEREGGKWELPALFLLAVLLANLHVYWVFIPLLWFFYRCAPRFMRRRSLSAASAWGGLFVLSLAGLFSPYGVLRLDLDWHEVFSNYYVILDYVFMPAVLRSGVNELKGVFLAGGIWNWVFVGYIVLAARLWRSNRAAAHIGSTLSALMGLILAASAVKFVPVFAVFSLPYFIRNSPAYWRRWSSSFIARRPWAVSTALTAACVFLLVLAVIRSPGFHRDYSEMEKLYPIQACREVAGLGLEPSPKRDHIRVLTHFDHGGWCRWAAYEAAPQLEMRVTTDNRTQWVPAQHFRKSFDLFFGQRDWRQTLKAWSPDVVVVKKEAALAQLLSFMPDSWQPVYSDGNFAVFKIR